MVTLRINKQKLLIIKQINKMKNNKGLNSKKQCTINSVVKRYLVKCIDAEGEREGIFNARTTKQAYKQARRNLWIIGDAEYFFTELDK